MKARIVATVAVALLSAGCSTGGTSSSAPSASATPQYASAQAIADKLRGAGFTVSALKLKTGDYVTNVGGTSDDLTIGQNGKAPAGTAGINMFPNPDALSAWVKLSNSFGGVAVTGDTWAVSLPTDGAARAASRAMAPSVARALGGQVQE